MGERAIALETYRHALDTDPKNKWLQEQVHLAKAEVVNHSKIEPIASVDGWITVFEAIEDSRQRLSTLAHLWNQCAAPDRHHILREFLSLISNAGAEHTGVHAEDFTEEMMVPLPMDNYEDLDPVETWMTFFRGLSCEDKVLGFRRMWEVTEEREKNVIVNDLRYFFLEPLLNAGLPQGEDDESDLDEEESGARDGPTMTGLSPTEITE